MESDVNMNGQILPDKAFQSLAAAGCPGSPGKAASELAFQLDSAQFQIPTTHD